MKKSTISDSIAKKQCKNYLEKLGYENITSAKGKSCDLLAHKDGILKLFEVKYSTRKDGSEFFGTVMFTELFEAINNENNLENWFYKIFSVSEFLKFCTLTTPIGHYRIRFNENKEILKTNVGIRGVKITKNMILDIWKKYREWKP